MLPTLAVSSNRAGESAAKQKTEIFKVALNKRESPMPEAPITIHLVQVWIIVPDVYIIIPVLGDL